ncbi:unnamed protein product [Cercospora beticola]|nr:unnamed protein product [Cercospora beticola]
MSSVDEECDERPFATSWPISSTCFPTSQYFPDATVTFSQDRGAVARHAPPDSRKGREDSTSNPGAGTLGTGQHDARCFPKSHCSGKLPQSARPRLLFHLAVVVTTRKTCSTLSPSSAALWFAGQPATHDPSPPEEVL